MLLFKSSFYLGKAGVFKSRDVRLLRRCFCCYPVFVAVGGFNLCLKRSLVLHHLLILYHFLVSVLLQRLSVLAPDPLLFCSQCHFFLLSHTGQVKVSVQQQPFHLRVNGDVCSKCYLSGFEERRQHIRCEKNHFWGKTRRWKRPSPCPNLLRMMTGNQRLPRL